MTIAGRRSVTLGSREAEPGQFLWSEVRDKCCMEKELRCIGPAKGPGITKPISMQGQGWARTGAGGARIIGGSIVRNKANSGRSLKFEVSRFKLEKQMVGISNFTLYTSDSAEGRPCETKPISPSVRATTSALWKKDYDESNSQRTSQEQSQFGRPNHGGPAYPAWLRAGKPACCPPRLACLLYGGVSCGECLYVCRKGCKKRLP